MSKENPSITKNSRTTKITRRIITVSIFHTINLSKLRINSLSLSANLG
jgi:hypothetical protein